MKTILVTPIEERHKQLIKDLDITVIDRNNFKEEEVLDAEVVLGNFPLTTLNKMKNLKWVQLDFAGVGEHLKLDENIILTNCSGAFGEAIAEHMLAYTLAIQKRLFGYLDNQKENEYKLLEPVSTISELKVLCVGTGNIGTEFAKRLKTLGAKVYGVNRTGKQNDLFEKIVAVDEIDTLLPEMDVIAISLPQTDKTYHLFDKNRLSKCKKGSILLNTGRGSVIDTKALIDLQKENHFLGVALDVFEEEPLPKDSPLWKLNNVYITPHISGKLNNAKKTHDLVIELMLDNYRHYLKNEPLKHLVNRKEGY